MTDAGTLASASTDLLENVRRALRVEIDGLESLRANLDRSMVDALQMLFACERKVVVTGMGKSGHVGRKIAATLASTGTPAFFLHPAEAIHGDLGMLARGDVVLALSNSGTTGEVVRLLGPLRRMRIPLIAMTGNPDSELARRAEIHINVSVPREACPLNLAPTASTTAALAMGDAIAVTLLEMRNFKPEDYAVFHPGGNLGKQLVTTVADIMDAGERCPIVPQSMPVDQAVVEIRAKNYGITAVVDDEDTLTGAFSLGDLLRLHTNETSLVFMSRPVGDFMIKNPKSIQPDALAARALNVMESSNIRALFVVNDRNQPVGIIGIYETLKAIDY